MGNFEVVIGLVVGCLVAFGLTKFVGVKSHLVAAACCVAVAIVGDLVYAAYFGFPPYLGVREGIEAYITRGFNWDLGFVIPLVIAAGVNLVVARRKGESGA